MDILLKQLFLPILFFLLGRVGVSQMEIPTREPREPRDEVFWVYCPTFEPGVDTTTGLMQGTMMFVFRVWGSSFI